MTAQISAYGRLVADPQTRTTANNKHMAMARLAVALPCHSAQNGEATYWLGVVAFGKQAELLAQHQKGDLISVAGNMQLNQWKAQDGTQQEAPQVIADSVISARTVHAGAQKTAGTAQGQPPTPQGTPPNHAPGWEVYQNEFDQRPPFDD
ncbi:single-stranded DNA-binding protein [Rahnella woolbedingensis]|uniref:Single-stranded DNA-binding protein n=1 Tax=Rahnella woolbedingensis TaxID=1510574 RepID=A0A419N9T8_9GAMM|nr:single-stranded DNA-binding protein [Rahnella woolbedingensis]RJT44536.1 single-stranded DNA-binding protein [Rahnella woolbedingensis]